MSAKILDNVLQAIGHTPMVRLGRLGEGVPAEIVVKLDFLNPGGSVKDRALVRMIREAEREGKLGTGATLVESSSGNLALAMAMAGAVRGYRVICVVDPKLTAPIRDTILALGGELVYADEADESGSYLRHRLQIRAELLESLPGAWCPDQYRNEASIRAHYRGTGEELVSDVQGHLDALVISTGTGGTITGCARRVKEALPGVRVIATDAIGSQIFDDEKRSWLQRGLGSGLSADELENLDLDVIDEVRLVGDQEAFMAARALARSEGLLSGGSAGCAVFAALTVAAELPETARVATVLPDRMGRYLDEFASDDWMGARGLDTESTRRAVWEAVKRYNSEADRVEGPAGITVRKWTAIQAEPPSGNGDR